MVARVEGWRRNCLAVGAVRGHANNAASIFFLQLIPWDLSYFVFPEVHECFAEVITVTHLQVDFEKNFSEGLVRVVAEVDEPMTSHCDHQAYYKIQETQNRQVLK